LIKIKNLKKSYNNIEILKNINLKINTGEIYGLVGASGAGKSTLLRCINGLVSHDSGSLSVDGIDISTLHNNSLNLFRKNIGMVFQQFSLLERLNVFENIALPMKHSNYPKHKIHDRVLELLSLVGLDDKKDTLPRELSGGQKQRVAIARALSLNPKILLCDEATSALDPNIAKSILTLISQINKKYNMTVIVVTHQMEVVRMICDRMAFLKNGELITHGEVSDVFVNQSDALSDLIGENTLCEIPFSEINLKVIINQNNENSMIFAVLGTKIEYRILWANTQKYKENTISTFIISVNQKNINAAVALFQDNNIPYHFINQKENI